MDPIIVDSLDEAQAMQSILIGLFNRQPHITLAEFKRIRGLTSTEPEETVGWTSIEGFNVEEVEGGYALTIPEPATL